MTTKVITSISHGVPAALSEVTTLGRTLKKRSRDLLAHSSAPAPPTARRRRSLAGSSTYAAPPSASATSPTFGDTGEASDGKQSLGGSGPVTFERLAAGSSGD